MDFLNFPDRFWLWAACLSYSIAFGLAISSIVRRRQRSRTTLYVLVAIGFVLQTTGLYQRGIAMGGCPIGNKFEVVQFLVWSAIVIFFAVAPAFRLVLLGFFTSGLASVLTLISLAMPSWDSARRSSLFSDNPWIEFHAAIGMLSYGAFGLLAIASAMYVLQNYSLKRRRFTGIFRLLPSLVELENAKIRLLLLGLALLSLSLGVGYFYFLQNQDAVSPIKLVSIGLTWIAYVMVLILRQARILHSNLLAWTCILLFGLVLLTLDPVSRSGQIPSVTTEFLSE